MQNQPSHEPQICEIGRIQPKIAENGPKVEGEEARHQEDQVVDQGNWFGQRDQVQVGVQIQVGVGRADQSVESLNRISK